MFLVQVLLYNVKLSKNKEDSAVIQQLVKRLGVFWMILHVCATYDDHATLTFADIFLAAADV